MFLKQLSIRGYKNFDEEFNIEFHPGLNILVGENASGKTAIVDAIRTLLREDEFGYNLVSESDFHRPFSDETAPLSTVTSFLLQADFADLSQMEQVAFLPWSNLQGGARLTLQVDKSQTPRGQYRKTLWGGVSQASIFESELFDTINCIYLPPLRDAESKLSEGRGSRLARLLKKINRKAIEEHRQRGEMHPLESDVKNFHGSLSNHPSIGPINNRIRDRLKEAVGQTFSQDTNIQFGEYGFNRIVENLRLLFHPILSPEVIDKEFRNLEENCLGYNNLLYLATILAELVIVSDGTNDENNPTDQEAFFKILLIEEPEAHLHPQLQIRLLEYLEKASRESDIQIIVTSHSPVLSSSASIKSIIHISPSGSKPTATPVRQCITDTKTENFLNRWLDTTKSTLFFARGVILVEGIAEAMLVPELGARVLKNRTNLPDSLKDAGVSVISIGGRFFQYFVRLFANYDNSSANYFPVRCSVITDKDPPKTPNNSAESTNPFVQNIPAINSSEYAKVFLSGEKTFEYDLINTNTNASLIAAVLANNWPTQSTVQSELSTLSVKQAFFPEDKAKIYQRISEPNMGKGLFSQLLADHLFTNRSCDFDVPKYIEDAVIWACGGNP